MNKNTHSNPFMRKHTEVKQEDDRWANLEIKEEPKKNRFQSEKNTDDAFRNKENSFSKPRSSATTSRNFRKSNIVMSKMQ